MDRLILEQDGCSLHAETDITRFPVEPFNTFSTFVFLFIFIYWVRKVGFKCFRYPLIVILLPIILLGVIAGIIHHSLRIDKAWNAVTVLSIFYSVVMTCVYFWYRLSGKWLYAFFLTMIFPLVFWIFYLNAEYIEKINLSVIFAAMSIAIMIPAALYCIKNKLKNLEFLALSSFLFTIGIICRISDLSLKPFFSCGSHFLWHIFGAASVFALIKYIYLADEQRAKELGLNTIERRNNRKIIPSLINNKDEEEGDDP